MQIIVISPFFNIIFTVFSTSDVESGFMINKYMDPFKYENALLLRDS